MIRWVLLQLECQFECSPEFGEPILPGPGFAGPPPVPIVPEIPKVELPPILDWLPDTGLLVNPFVLGALAALLVLGGVLLVMGARRAWNADVRWGISDDD